MGTQTDTERRPLKMGRRIWVFFGFLLVALISSAVMGTRTVRANSCSYSDCQRASSYAQSFCTQGGHGSVILFYCPFQDETDDYLFECADQYIDINDCITNNPS